MPLTPEVESALGRLKAEGHTITTYVRAGELWFDIDSAMLAKPAFFQNSQPSSSTPTPTSTSFLAGQPYEVKKAARRLRRALRGFTVPENRGLFQIAVQRIRKPSINRLPYMADLRILLIRYLRQSELWRQTP